jgi:hypothetical protein
MRDEQVPHDGLERLDVRRPARGRARDDDRDVGELRRVPSGLPTIP